MKTKVFNLLITALLIISCSPYKNFYQVYEVSSPDVKQQDGILVYETVDCRLVYNLWSDGGNMNFLITNKTDKNLFLVMPKSFFILNGVANDYYTRSSHSLAITNNIAVSKSAGITISGYLSNGLLWYPSTLSRHIGVGLGTSKTETVKTDEVPYICVPPKASKFIKGFNLSDYVYKDCENTKANHPKTVSSKVSYTEANSPLVFKNRIAYSFDEKESDIKYIDNSFYVVSFQNFSEKSAFDVKREKPCEGSEKVKNRYFKMSAPNKFYNRYQAYSGY